MLETLLVILRWDLRSPEILLEEDGDICLDWNGIASVSINETGKVSWAIFEGKRHGTDIEVLHNSLMAALKAP